MKPQHIAAGYLLIQAGGIAVWWALLLTYPALIGWFQPRGWPPQSLLGFWLADGLLLWGGSIVTAAAVWRSVAWASTAVWALAAACAYPTLYCIGVSATTGEAWLASAMMTTAAGLTLAMATIYGNAQQQPATFRAVRMTVGRAFIWTSLQIVVFWSVFFAVLPMAIVEIESALGITRFDHPFQRTVSVLLFTAAGALGLSSAVCMIKHGRGTPLPTATAAELMVCGPYRWLRNPMATAGIAQGLAVGWYLGSTGVIAYALTGGLLWHCAVRPAEEADLTARFGDRYQTYQRSVGLWCPRRRYMKNNKEISGDLRAE